MNNSNSLPNNDKNNTNPSFPVIIQVMSLNEIIQVEHSIAMLSPDVSLTWYNALNSTTETEFEPRHKDYCMNILQDAIIAKIGEMRTPKEDMDGMIIRKNDISNKR